MKTKFTFLLVVIGMMLGCQPAKTDDSPKIKKGMIKMAILYPNGEGKTFDMDYYVNKHMTLAKTLLGDSVKIVAIDKGLAAGAPNTPMPYQAMGYFYFEKMSALQNSMKTAREKLVADVPNFTNIQPVVQISEVMQKGWDDQLIISNTAQQQRWLFFQACVSPNVKLLTSLMY